MAKFFVLFFALQAHFPKCFFFSLKLRLLAYFTWFWSILKCNLNLTTNYMHFFSVFCLSLAFPIWPLKYLYYATKCIVQYTHTHTLSFWTHLFHLIVFMHIVLCVWALETYLNATEFKSMDFMIAEFSLQSHFDPILVME